MKQLLNLEKKEILILAMVIGISIGVIASSVFVYLVMGDYRFVWR